ncbi:MAG: flagellin [Defluviimonas sp.]|uniref:flagellin N-terminal helical domain-containing protein n=1 Tax=Albidovulum sp. TaxID=1872424 RepID=UPI002A333ABA|nr:flagellin [Defluviimonas sp.]
MSSILTNTSSMVALQTLRGINNNLAKTQDEISTGKAVSSAKDNAAVWAISKVMESDVKGFKGISDSLNLGESTVAVGRQAAETVTDLMTEIKGKIVAAQQDNVDRTKLQTDVTALVDQIKTVVGSAQFSGLNLVDGSQSTVDVLASLDRQSSGTVSTSSITINAQNLSVGGYTAKAAFTGTTGASTAADSAATSLAKADTTGVAIVLDDAITYAAGDSISIRLGNKEVSYTVTAEDAAQSAGTVTNIIAAGLKSAADGLGITDLRVDFAANDGTNDASLTFKVADTNGDTVASLAQDLTITAQFKNAGSGGLGALSSIDVTTANGAAAALGSIEGLIQTGIDAAAEFGSVQSRIEIQSDFIGKLSDSLKAGIGSMIDADMEEASARLQALQVQQQLGIQSLSIANQAPQSILSLFR